MPSWFLSSLWHARAYRALRMDWTCACIFCSSKQRISLFRSPFKNSSNILFVLADSQHRTNVVIQLQLELASSLARRRAQAIATTSWVTTSAATSLLFAFTTDTFSTYTLQVLVGDVCESSLQLRLVTSHVGVTWILWILPSSTHKWRRGVCIIIHSVQTFMLTP